MTDPDLTTEIIGYRQWYVTPDLDLRAAGHASRSVWTPGDNTAVCRRLAPMSLALTYAATTSPLEGPKPEPCNDTPGEDCECGFYALHDPSDFWYGKPTAGGNAFGGYLVSPESDPCLSGIIVAWGKVQVHYQGFRAEHARIAALALPEGRRDAAVARAVAAVYGVPCVPVADLPKIAAEFGTTVPVHMRPEKPEPSNDLVTTWQQAVNQAINGQIGQAYNSAFISGNSWHYHTSPAFQFGSPAPQPRPRRRSLFERKQSNRQGPHEGKQRAPKNQRGKPWGAW